MRFVVVTANLTHFRSARFVASGIADILDVDGRNEALRPFVGLARASLV